MQQTIQVNHIIEEQYDQNGYGGMQYYSSETCGNVNHNLVYDGCTTDYTQSEVKYAVDAWAQAQAPAANEARLIELADLKNNLGYVLDTSATSEAYLPSSSTPSWIYNSDYGYWTMTSYQDSSRAVWRVDTRGGLSNINGAVYLVNYVVRPVITISKSHVSKVG